MAVVLIQEAEDEAPTGPTAVLGSTPTPGTLLVAICAERSETAMNSMPVGWTEVPAGPTLGPAFDGGAASLFYKVAGASEPTSIQYGGVSRSSIWVGEFGGVGALVDSDSADDIAAATTLSAGPSSLGSGGILAFAVFNQSARDGTSSGGNPPDFDFDSGWTREINNGVDASGPSIGAAWRVYSNLAGDVSVSCTATNNDGYGWLLATFTVADLPAGPYADWEFDGFSTNDEFGEFVESWRITRGSPPEVTGAASIGQATIVLNNPTDDRFNPLNSSGPLYGQLTDGVPVWIGVNSDGALTGSDPRGLFAGYLQSIRPIPQQGNTRALKVELQCQDALARYGRTPARVAPDIFRSHREMREAVLDAIGETRVNLAREIHTTPLSSWDGKALAALEELNKANGTRHFIKPANDADAWYSYTTRNRQWRLGGTVDASISGTVDHFTSDGWTLSGDTAINQQRASVTPVTFTQGAIEVWQAETVPFRVLTGKPKSFFVEFDDYVRDPTVNVNSSGSALTATLEPFGDTAKLTLTSAGTSTVSALSIEGRLARRMPTESYVADDTASQALRGERAGSDIGSTFIGIMASARGIAKHVVWRYGSPQFRPTLTVTNWLPEQFEIDLYDVISVTIAKLSMTARRFEVVGLTHEGRRAHSASLHEHVTTYVLQECRVQTDDPGWFVLDASLLDDPDVLAY